MKEKFESLKGSVIRLMKHIRNSLRKQLNRIVRKINKSLSMIKKFIEKKLNSIKRNIKKLWKKLQKLEEECRSKFSHFLSLYFFGQRVAEGKGTVDITLFFQTNIFECCLKRKLPYRLNAFMEMTKESVVA